MNDDRGGMFVVTVVVCVVVAFVFGVAIGALIS